MNMYKSKSRNLWQALLTLLVLIVAGASFSSARAQDNLEATLSTDGREITVGDVIPLTLRVTHPAGWRVIIPSLEAQWGELEVRAQSVPEIITNPAGTQTTIQEIQVVRMRPGAVQTPPLLLSVADDQGSLNNLEVAPVSITVGSVLIEGDTNLREIKPQADLVLEGRPTWPIVAAGAIGAALLIVYGVRLWRRRKLVDRRTPRQRALDELNALSAQNIGAPNAIKSQCARLADTLRDYLTAVTHLPARDMTTRELARRSKDQDIPPVWSAQVVEILQICDGVKFADDELEGSRLESMIATIRQLVEQYPSQAQPKPRRSGLMKQNKKKKQQEVMA